MRLTTATKPFTRTTIQGCVSRCEILKASSCHRAGRAAVIRAGAERLRWRKNPRRTVMADGQVEVYYVAGEGQALDLGQARRVRGTGR